MNQRSGRNGGRNEYHAPARTDYQQALGKITMPFFYGSSKCTTRAWVQKLDNYLSLRPMLEEDAIRFATLHLEEAAHEWWYHKLITLGHNLITTYDEFTNRLIERFDVKDPEVNFHELAPLKQHGTLETYVADFQRLSIMVPNISERRLVVLFMEGLMEPLRGWLKAFDPPTLQEVMKKARSMEFAAPKSRSAHKNVPSTSNESPQQLVHKKKKSATLMDEETQEVLRRKKL